MAACIFEFGEVLCSNEGKHCQKMSTATKLVLTVLCLPALLTNGTVAIGFVFVAAGRGSGGGAEGALLLGAVITLAVATQALLSIVATWRTAFGASMRTALWVFSIIGVAYALFALATPNRGVGAVSGKFFLVGIVMLSVGVGVSLAVRAPGPSQQ